MEILQRTAWLWLAVVLMVACAAPQPGASQVPQPGASQAPQTPQAPAQTPQAASAETASTEESPLQRRARDVAALFRAVPDDGAAGGYAALFTEEFLGKVPPAQLTALFTDFHAKFGPCVKVTSASAQNPFAGKFDFLFEKGYSAPVTLSIEAAAPHHIIGLLIGNAVRLAATLDDVVKEMKALPGEVSFLLAEINGPQLKPLAAHNSDRAGYKGGSEPGVLNLTFLLRGASGKWYAMSAGWNNPQAAVDESKFIGLVERATQLVN